MTLSDRTTSTATAMPNEQREAACAGYEVDGSKDQMWTQLMAHDVSVAIGAAPDKNNPAGLLRTPTFSRYGWNTSVAGQLTPPTLVMEGVDDTGLPAGAANAPAVYDALQMTNKVLVQLDCATHSMLWEGCSNAPRCMPTSGTPYGGVPGQPWAGAHSTIKAALIEWISSTTFNGAPSGKFIVNSSEVAHPNPT